MAETTAVKKCATCGEAKPRSEFHRRSDRPDGLVSSCKPCVAERNRRRYAGSAEVRERIAQASKAWREQRSPEQVTERRARNAAWMRGYREQNRDEINDRARQAKEADPERFREYARSWREANPEKVAEWYRRWREANPERAAAARAAHYARNASAYKARAAAWAREHPEVGREIGRRYRARKASATIGPVDLEALWTGSCALCGDDLDPALRFPHPLSKSVDHILPLSRGGSHTQDNLQWTHLVCNVRKGAKPPE